MNVRLRFLLWVLRRFHGGRVRIEARCGTYYNLLGVLGFVDFLRGEGIQVTGFSVGYRSFLGRAPLQGAVPAAAELGIRLYEIPEPAQVARNYLLELFRLFRFRRDAVIFCSAGVMTFGGMAAAAREFPHSRLYWCRIEDGIGSYDDVRARILFAARLHANDSHLSLKMRVIAFAEQLLSGIFLRVPWLMFDLSGEKPRARPEVIGGYQHAVGLLAKAMRWQPPKLERGTVIFLSQPLVEMGACGEQEYQQYLRSVQAELAGLSPFRIKPHPLEDAGKFQQELLLSDAMPIEVVCLLGRESIAMVAGINSTSLYTVPVLYGIPSAVCEAEVVREFLDSAGGSAKKILRACVSKWVLIGRH